MANQEEINVAIICNNEEDQERVEALFKRSAAAMSAIDEFSNSLIGLDQNAPDFMEKTGIRFARLLRTLYAISTPGQRANDTKALGDLRTRTIGKVQHG